MFYLYEISHLPVIGVGGPAPAAAPPAVAPPHAQDDLTIQNAHLKPHNTFLMLILLIFCWDGVDQDSEFRVPGTRPRTPTGPLYMKGIIQGTARNPGRVAADLSRGAADPGAGAKIQKMQRSPRVQYYPD